MPEVIITAPAGSTPLEAVRPININGRAYRYAYGKPVILPDAAIMVAREAGLTVTLSPASDLPAGNGDVAAEDGAPGGDNLGGSDTDPTFDAEAIIAATIPEVEKSLAGLTLEQLAAVEAAEIDRELPRVGVREAIARARSAFTNQSDQ